MYSRIKDYTISIMTAKVFYVKVRYRKKKSGSEGNGDGKGKDIYSYSVRLFISGKSEKRIVCE